MLEIRRGKKEEFDQIIDFIDFVFSKNSCPHDFLEMYPNLYRRTDESMNNLVNLWDDNEIVASVLVYPRTLCIGGKKLKVCGIGSVAAHPRYRGRGYMTKLLSYITSEMKADGTALSNLGGRRTRYNHFGYEIGGNGYGIEFSWEAIKTVLPDYEGSGYKFEKFGGENKALIGTLMEIYNSKPVHYDYDEDDFFLRLIIPSDGAYPLAVYSDDGLLGYIAVSPGKDDDDLYVREICLKDDSLVADVLMTLAVSGKYYIGMRFSEYDFVNLKEVFKYTGEVKFEGSGMWNVFNWKDTVEALLRCKASYMPLAKGRLVIDIEGSGRYSVIYDGRDVSVEPTDDAADFAFSKLDAVRALTGPASAAMFGFGSDADTLSLIKSWFPLPLISLSTERV